MSELPDKIWVRSVIERGGALFNITVSNQPRPPDEAYYHERIVNEQRELLEALLNYQEGRPPYDFTHLQGGDRDNAAFDAWQEIEDRIRASLEVTDGE